MAQRCPDSVNTALRTSAGIAGLVTFIDILYRIEKLKSEFCHSIRIGLLRRSALDFAGDFSRMLLVNSICSAHSLPLIGSHRRDRWPKFGVSIGLAFADTLSDRFWPILLKKSTMVSPAEKYASEIEIFTFGRGFGAQISRSSVQKRRFNQSMTRLFGRTDFFNRIGRLLPLVKGSFGSVSAGENHPMCWSNPMQTTGQVECKWVVKSVQLGKKSFLPGMLTNDGYRAPRFAQLNGSHDL